MKTEVRLLTIAATTLLTAVLFSGCREKASRSEQVMQRGEPVLSNDIPVYDKTTQTFSLTVHADSIGDATVSYALLDGDSVIMKSEDGQFSGITPFEEGYNVRLSAQWEDTTIERTIHVMDFIVPRDPVEKMTEDELELLINACDKSLRRSKNDHLAQGVKLVVKGTKLSPPLILPDVITYIENGVWQKVDVIKVEYDDNNLINSITLKPIGEVVDVDEDEDMEY